MKKNKIHWPHTIDHDNKVVSVYVESGYPTVMGVPHVVNKIYPDYKVVFLKESP